MTENEWKMLLGAVVGIFVLIFIVAGLRGCGCYAAWSDSKYESDYGLISGCRVKVDGVWIPEANVRRFVGVAP